MQPLPWLPMYYLDLLNDEKVKLMSNAQFGIYHRFLYHQWHEGSLPSEASALSAIAHVSPDLKMTDHAEMCSVVNACFKKNGRRGRLKNTRLEQVRHAQLIEVEKNKARTEKARQAICDKRSTVSVTESVTDIVTATNPKSESKSESDSSSSSSVLKKEPSRKASANRRSVLPEDFQPKPKHEEIANGLGINLAVELVKFRDHHQAKGSLMLDWDAALRKWLRNAVEFRRPR